MKKYIYITLLLLGVLLLNYSCNKEAETKNDKLYVYEKTQRNEDYNNLAKIVSAALTENPDFRRIVKHEALLKFDGDYDILLSVIKNKSFADYGYDGQNNLARNNKIGSFLSSYVEKLDIDIHKDQHYRGSAQDYIDQLAQQYPTLQISVPVHADEWTENFVPKVTFIPEQLDDGEDVDIVAYKNNNTTTVNAKTAPTEPVVVIGDNERAVDSSIHGTPAPLVVSGWNLQASQTQSGIKLLWNYSSVSSTIIGYNVYRKKNTETQFSLLQTVYGVNNMVFDDITVRSNQFYSYYVTAFEVFNESNPSSIVNKQAPVRPSSLEDFSASLHSSSSLELRWNIPVNQSVDYVELSKMTVGVDQDYSLLNTFPSNITNYIDQNVNAGRKIIYKSRIATVGNHFSNYKYDFVQVPYRDVSQRTPVYLEKISFDWNHIDDIEGWMRGAPEFRISVVRTNESGEKMIIQNGVNVAFCSRHSWNYYNDINLHDWKPSNFLEVLTFYVIEVDGGPEVDLKFKALYNHKNTSTGSVSSSSTSNGTTTGTGSTSENTTTLSGELNVTINDALNSADEKIGSGYLHYTDPESKVVSIPGDLRFKMFISTIDTSHNCND